jgi:hypothetical protein
MPSAISACDFEKIPMLICTAVSTRFTPTLTQVLRVAAAMRSAGVCWLSSGSSARSVKFMGSFA